MLKVRALHATRLRPPARKACRGMHGQMHAVVLWLVCSWWTAVSVCRFELLL